MRRDETGRLEPKPLLVRSLDFYRGRTGVSLDVQNAIKDERLPLEKCAIGKGRLFSIIFFPYVAHIRQYSVPLLGHFFFTGFNLGIMSGINPHSLDFDRLVSHLTFAPDVSFIDGDYSGFDYAIPDSVGDAVFEYFAHHFPPQYYEEILEIGRSLKINRNFLDRYSYTRSTGNCSGQPLTLLYNCVANKFLMYSAIDQYLLSKGLPSPQAEQKDRLDFISDHMRDAYFGDDHILSVDSYIPITPTEIQSIFASWDIVYTSTSKTSVMTLKDNIEDVEFLKRKFWRNSYGNYVGILFPSVIFESLMWRRHQKGITVQATIDAVFSSMFDEVALMGEPAIRFFNVYVDFIYSIFFRCARPPYSFKDRVLTTGLFSATSPAFFFEGFVDYHAPLISEEMNDLLSYMRPRVKSDQGLKALSSLEYKLSLRPSHDTPLFTDNCSEQEYPSY